MSLFTKRARAGSFGHYFATLISGVNICRRQKTNNSCIVSYSVNLCFLDELVSDFTF
jgi:hypothetical protein